MTPDSLELRRACFGAFTCRLRMRLGKSHPHATAETAAAPRRRWKLYRERSDEKAAERSPGTRCSRKLELSVPRLLRADTHRRRLPIPESLRRRRSAHPRPLQNQRRRGPFGSEKPSESLRWWSRSDSNRRPLRCERSALPTELRPQRSKRIAHQNRGT